MTERGREGCGRRTWRMVTGNLTPWSFHMEVMPRLRAMRPVLVDCGAHFLGAFVASAPGSCALLDDASEVAGEEVAGEL